LASCAQLCGAVQAYQAQVGANIAMRVDMSGNSFECPDASSLSAAGFSVQAVQLLGCKRKRGSAGKIVLALCLVVFAIGLVVAALLWWRRRARMRSHGGKGLRELNGSNGGVDDYVSQAESQREMGIGPIDDDVLSMQGSGKGHANGSLSPRGSGAKWHMPKVARGGKARRSRSGRSKRYVDEALEGSGSLSGGASAFQVAAERAARGSGPPLPLSGAGHRAPGGYVDVGRGPPLRRQPESQHELSAGLHSVEAASPMSDISPAVGAPRSSGGTRAAFAPDERGGDGDTAERNMRVTFNAAYAPGEH
jgi:hypothetical protein